MRSVFFICFCSIFLFGCRKSCPSGFEHQGIFASEIRQYDYCELILKSLKKNPSAFQKFISIELEGGLIINHANDIVRLIEKIGTATICEWIEKGEVDKNRLVYVLKAASIDHSKVITAKGNLNCD